MFIEHDYYVEDIIDDYDIISHYNDSCCVCAYVSMYNVWNGSMRLIAIVIIRMDVDTGTVHVVNHSLKLFYYPPPLPTPSFTIFGSVLRFDINSFEFHFRAYFFLYLFLQ